MPSGPAALCRRRPPLLLAALLLAAATAAHAQPDAAFNLTLDYAPNRNLYGQPLMTVSRADVAGREMFYEVPQAPVGILAFFHGCHHNAYDLWYKQPECEECRGLPAEVSHTKQALARGYAVLAMNSLERGDDPEAPNQRCFSYPTDKDSAVEALRTLIADLGLEELPLYLAGVSSGAAFALKLPNDMPGEIAGIIAEVLAVDPDKEDYDWASWPPVAFISMAKDPPTSDRIKRNQEVLRQEGVPAQTIHVPERVVYWPAFFSDQASDISPDLSQKIVTALVEIGVLDQEGWLKDDPRHGFAFDWRGRLREAVPELDDSGATFSLEADASDVSELLNTAYSQHEVIGDYTTAILAWFERGGSGDLTQLTEDYLIRRPALLSATRLQPGQKPATAGDPPVQPWTPPPPPLQQV